MALVLQLAHASRAQAGTFGFCEGVTLGGFGECNNGIAVSHVYQDYGWGDNHSVCVALHPGTGWACSGGPGQGVYSGEISGEGASVPAIENNAAGSNRVHGVYFTR
jgi:hypothetical protein